MRLPAGERASGVKSALLIRWLSGLDFGMNKYTKQRSKETIFLRYRSCSRKVKYGHKETSEKAVRAMAEKGAGTIESYKCHFCNGWHIGH